MAKLDKSSQQIAMILDSRAREDARVRKELLLFSRKVHRYWRRIAPVGDPTGKRYEDNFGGPLPKHWSQTDDEAGSYKAGIIKRRGKRINGMPSYVIAATDYKSHWIEYGTGGDTPTPEFACRQRTATRFGAMGGVSATKANVDTSRSTGISRRRGIKSLEISGKPMGKPARRGSGYEPPEPGESAA